MLARSFTSYLLQPVILCLWALWVTGCSVSEDPQNRFHTFNGPTMGTWYNVKIQGLPDSLSETAVKQAIDAELNGVNEAMSTWREDSELSRFNRAPVQVPFPMSADTRQVLAISAEVYEASGGAFDITVGPLVNLWGFGPDKQEDSIPPPEDISRLLQEIGGDAIRIQGEQVSKSRPVQIDLSAVAKGYGVDKVASRLEALGIRRYMVEVGGEIRVGDAKLSGETWKIAIEEPTTLSRSIQKVLSLKNVAIATSGDYRNFYEKDGKRYSHTIDPRTGSPVAHKLASVSVIHESCAYADAWATALTVLGPEESLKLAEKLNLAVYLLVKTETGFEALQSESFSRYVDPAAI